MNILIREPENKPLVLDAHRALFNCKDIQFNNIKYNTRHPLGIYNISINKVLDRTILLLDELKTIEPLQKKSTKPNNDTHLKNATDHYLDSIAEHFDDCLKIIKTIHQTTDGNKTRAVCRKFNKKISSFRDHIATQVNLLKHEQANIDTIYFYNESFTIPGYYINGVLKGGTIGPNPIIHPKGNSAFSYSRELRKNLCGIFHTSISLSKILKENIDKLKITSSKESNSKLENVFEEIANFQYMFFPDEYRKTIPVVKKYKKHKIIQFPGKNHHPLPLPSRMGIKNSYTGDGVSKSFKLPYMGEGIG